MEVNFFLNLYLIDIIPELNNKTVLQVENLSIGATQADGTTLPLVHDISYHINSGEIVGLVGESGSGKSISSLAILGLMDDALVITNGNITFENTTLNYLNDKELQKIRGKEISMVFQEPMSSLNPVMRCGKQVDEMLLAHSSSNTSNAKKHTLELFRKVQLPDIERAYNAYPHQLSGGQLQRIMIAMALACDPTLLIADECTTALDVTVQQEILSLLHSLNKELGIAVLFISHDLDVISDIADRIIVMRKGKIVEQGKTRDIFRNPQHPYTHQLIASKPKLNTALKQLPKPSIFLSTEKQEIEKEIELFYSTNTLSPDVIQTRKTMLDDSEILVQVKDLVKFYPGKKNFWGKPLSFVKAVDHVNFDIRKGETMGLVGESGCGKSTLSKAILRLIEADSGDVIINGDSIFSMDQASLRRKRKDIQYIFQDPYSSLNPRLKIGFALQEPMAVHNILPTKKQRKERVIELLELVGLEADHYDRYPHQFSGGQRQRICIARALGLNPSFIVCDEIVSALDVSVQAQVLNLLLELRENFDLTLLFVSHDLSIVKFLSDRLIIMNKGKIEEAGWADEIYKNPKSAYTKKLLDAIPGKTLRV